MKQKCPSEDDKALSRLLRQWKMDASLPSRFDQEVWRRIELAETRRGMGHLSWAGMRDWITTVLPRPAVAVAYMVVLLAFGAGFGWTQAQHESSLVRHQLSARYVQLVDPYKALH